MYFQADMDPTFHFDAETGPTFHCDADSDTAPIPRAASLELLGYPSISLKTLQGST